MKPTVTLTVKRLGFPDEVLTFGDHDAFVIGRADATKVLIPNNKPFMRVSRYHCQIEINPPQVRVKDLGSLHGTKVNGEIIGKRNKNAIGEQVNPQIPRQLDLKDGDVIALSESVQILVSVKANKLSTSSFSDNSRIESETGLKANAEVKDLNKLFPGYQFIARLPLERHDTEIYHAVEKEGKKDMVAIKILTPNMEIQEHAQRKFKRMVDLWGKLNHRNIVQMRDYFFSDGRFCVVMDWCNTGDLDSLTEQYGKLSYIDAVDFILPVLDGLHYAHTCNVTNPYETGPANPRGIVHRDIKPANIFLHRENDCLIPKIGDFGLMKAFELAGYTGMTVTNTVAGTLEFQSRRQVEYYRYAKPDADVWAVAATLYFLLTGEPPRDFSSDSEENEEGATEIVLNYEPVPICEREPSIPRPLASVIDRALEDKGTLAFPTAADLKIALVNALSQIA